MGKGKVERERGRLRGKEEYRELWKGHQREVEGEGKRKVGKIGKGNAGKGNYPIRRKPPIF